LNMPLSPSAGRLREIIGKAIDDHIITRSGMDLIIAMTTEDSHVDHQEQVLLE
jgi:hypothetical protein